MFATLIDFDGVLVDSEPVHLAAFNDVLRSRGLATIDAREYAERYLSLDDDGVFRAVISRGGMTVHEEDVRALVQAKAPRFMARFEDAFRVFPGAPELLARRAARGPVGIVSGALEREIVFALGRMGARDAVSFVISADGPHLSKPDPAPYLAAVARLSGAGHAGGMVAIEDALGGVKSAKAAGLRCVAVGHSFGDAELRAAGADAVVDGLGALDDALLEGV